MYCRTSHVHTFTNISIDASSVIEIGDSEEINAIANILAVQRDKAIFYENEFQFGDYTAFCEPLPLPVDQEPICLLTFHETPSIRVDKVNVSFAAASSLIHIGSSECVQLETRVKNIRHLVRDQR
ncbi:spore germination protein GerPE [Brevibacillus choshinensis]|uniref:spore germination protein GerPE n=1 Tax=Brevibacillus choshinensis TaxID=54911 RepID=UPI002E1EBF86|nr:spore germination protein GerPE [Brevibacillus choshinensis]MED4752084.1 spore germination protein GerPE [Brevibacillus choshinensis]MED4784515.1 spore germination protein GerPE [Brevibacillus choshinensis]